MKVKILKGSLSTRDADFNEINKRLDFSEKPVSDYLKRMQTIITDQSGNYRSIQGSTITPQPFWSIEVEVVEKKAGAENIIQPRKENGRYMARTAKWALEVAGTGQQKEKWRGLTMDGPISPRFLYSVVTSGWMVPFSIIHRYMVFIPAIPATTDSESRLLMLKDIARDDRMDRWTDSDESKYDDSIIEWTGKAQKKWQSAKTSLSVEQVTERLDYNSTLSNQKPKTIRLVHTRSRFLKAAVLDPNDHTALGLPLTKLVLNKRKGIEIIDREEIPITGVITDNLLHWIAVESVEEAHWLSGIFNSEVFRKIVMKQAGGERGSEYVPSIYSLPAKILAQRKLAFDPSDKTHQKISDLAKDLSDKMAIVARSYLQSERSIIFERLDDTVECVTLPTTVASTYIDRLAEKHQKDVDKLEELVKDIL